MKSRRDGGPLWAVGILIALHALFLGLSATHNSVMFDEAAHLPAGCAYLRYAEFSVDNFNPPLIPMIAAAPVMVAHPQIPDAFRYRKMTPSTRIWDYAAAFGKVNRDRYQHLFVLGRFALIPISCLGALIVFVWASQLYGQVAGVAACAMWVFCPDILAHGSIVGADVGVAVAMMLALWRWQSFCIARTTKNVLLAGLASGLAHACKLTAFALWPAFGLMLLLALIRNRHAARDLILGFTSVVILTFAILNLSYGYSGTFEPFDKFEFRSTAMQSIQQHLGSIPTPLPRQLLLGMDSLKWEWEQKYAGYLLGETYLGTRWNYYPIALLSKLPISLLSLLAMSWASLVVPTRNRLRCSSVDLALVIAQLGLMVFVLGSSQVNIGVRHLLPLYPLCIILAARLWTLGPIVRRIGWFFIAVLVVESLSICPRYLTFFNALAGGPNRGWTIVNDSNYDWGQSLIDLAKWQREANAGPIELAYFGRADPKAYGIDYVPFNDGNSAKYVVISSYFLTGQRQRAYADRDEPLWIQIPYYQKLQKMTPIVRPGGALFAFKREDIELAKAAAP